MHDGEIVGRRKARRWRPPVIGSVALILALAAGWLAYIGALGGPLYLDLPARGVPHPSRPDVAAVIFSGDMGFRIGMTPKISAAISDMGIPVTAVSSLEYFRTRRSPAEVRAYIAAAMDHATRTTGARRLILVGQSYGADMLHVGLSTLPEAQRDRIIFVVMVVPTDTIYFQIGPGELTEWARPDAHALPTARMLTWVPVLCIHGIEERDSLCPKLTQPGVRRITLPGGHPLDHDSATLSATLVREIGARLAAQE